MKKSIEISANIETLFGTRDENLRVLEDGLNISIDLRSDSIEVEGSPSDVTRAQQVFTDYEHLQRSGFTFNNGDLNSMLRVLTADPKATLRGLAEAGRQRSFGRRTVQPKSVNQRRYLEAIEKHDMVFGIGPAGTGKTYLAVAMAISALLAKRVNRIILARPAVEAGERLGFLPGTLQDKIDPYLRPLYDALYDMLDPEKADRYLEKNVIELGAFAFMGGGRKNRCGCATRRAIRTGRRTGPGKPLPRRRRQPWLHRKKIRFESKIGSIRQEGTQGRPPVCFGCKRLSVARSRIKTASSVSFWA